MFPKNHIIISVREAAAGTITDVNVVAAARDRSKFTLFRPGGGTSSRHRVMKDSSRIHSEDPDVSPGGRRSGQHLDAPAAVRM